MLILYENDREVCQLIGGEFPHEKQIALQPPNQLIRYSSLTLDPALLIVGAAGIGSLLPWMSAVVRSTAYRRNLELVSYDPLTRKGRRSQMHECLLTGMLFPALDRSSKSDASVKLSVLPERMSVSNQPATTGMTLAKAAGIWKASDFTIDIAGIPGLNDIVQSIGALDVTQVSKAFSVGPESKRTNEPAALKHGNLILTLSSSKAGAVTEWASQELLRETPSPQLSLQGALTYLSGKKPLFTLEFTGIGIVKVVTTGAMPRLELFHESVRLGA